MMPTALQRPSDSSLPSDLREYEAWVDAKIEGFQAVLERSLKLVSSSEHGVPAEWFKVLYDDLVPMLAQLHFEAAWVNVRSEPNEHWITTVTEKSWDAAFEAGHRMNEMAGEVWRATQAMIAAITDPVTAAKIAAANEALKAIATGEHTGMLLLPHSEQPVEHQWLSMRDDLVRHSHVEADGQTVPFSERFSVGFTQMWHPHDGTAPAAEVMNCRCVEVFLFPGDERADGTVVPASDELTEMDLRNEWRQQPETLDSNTFYQLRRNQRDAMTEVQRTALSEYETVGFEEMNDTLRHDADHGNEVTRRVAHMKWTFNSPATSSPAPDVLYRGIRNDWYGDVWRPGMVFRDHGFTSTTSMPAIAEDFATGGTKQTLMRINNDAGKRVVFGHSGEMEVILPPGSTFEVVSVTEVPHDSGSGHILRIVEVNWIA